MTSRHKWFSFDFNAVESQKLPNTSNERKDWNETFPLKQNKRKVRNKHNNENNTTGTFFTDVQPDCLDDLPVHAKKIAEASGWLDQFVLKSKKSDSVSYLLVSGPTGCAKTATINLLCRLKGIEVLEWSNPVESLQVHTDDEFGSYMRQSDRFLEFLIESSFPSLLSKCKHRLCLVKDFPNVFLQKPEEFHDALKQLRDHPNINIVFIVTDHAAKSVNIERNLFQDAVKLEHKIGSICFNACAATLMKKAASRAVQVFKRQPQNFSVPSSDVIEAICASSDGDVRCCMNQLYIAALKYVGQMPVEIKASTDVKTGSKRKCKTKSVALKSKLKDEALGLFHSIGRVLNPKINPETKRIQCDLDALITEMSVHPLTIAGFLFRNYVEHFGDLFDLVQASETLSRGVRMMERLPEQPDVPLMMIVMGLMLQNRHKVSKWSPIRAPLKWKAEAKRSPRATLSAIDQCYVQQIKGEAFDRFERKN